MAYRSDKDMREYARQWYQKNKEVHKARAKANRARQRTSWQEFKAQQVCAHCGAQHPAIIDFHHVDRNEANKKVYKLVSSCRFAEARREAELRCIPLCANCHRILHWDEGH